MVISNWFVHCNKQYRRVLSRRQLYNGTVIRLECIYNSSHLQMYLYPRWGQGRGGGEVTPQISFSGVVWLGSPNSDPISDQICNFLVPFFQTWGPFLERPGNYRAR